MNDENSDADNNSVCKTNKFRCPYCKTEFVNKLDKFQCPNCNKNMRPPAGYMPQKTKETRRKIEFIKKKYSAEMKKLGPRAEFNGGRRPGIMFAIILVMLVLGILLISTSKKNVGKVEAKPSQRDADPYGYTTNNMSILAMALRHYYEDTEEYPSYADGSLSALINDVGAFNWNGPYINVREIPADGWNRQIAYELKDGFPLMYSAGPDRRYKTEDDIIVDSSEYKISPTFIPANPTNRNSRARINKAIPSVKISP